MKNPSIKCNVTSCKYNMDSEHYCTLDCIQVGTHEKNPTVPECTDCMSFVKKQLLLIEIKGYRYCSVPLFLVDIVVVIC